MSSVKRYNAHYITEGVMGGKALACAEMVLASDYDKLACLVDPGHKLTMDAACGEIAALEAERDALRARVEAMRELLRKVAPHFAAPPGFGHLHADIDAALQAEQ